MKMKVICEFDMAKPRINDEEEREKSRVIEDENGIWRIQSKSAGERLLIKYRLDTSPDLKLTKDQLDGWVDEFRSGEDYPGGCQIGTTEYSTRMLNMSSILKAVFKAGSQK